MTRKNIKQNWKERQQKIFKELKENFTMELVLVTLNLNKEMRVKANVLDFAMKRVLLMKCEDGKQRPVTRVKQKRGYAKVL